MNKKGLFLDLENGYTLTIKNREQLFTWRLLDRSVLKAYESYGNGKFEVRQAEIEGPLPPKPSVKNKTELSKQIEITTLIDKNRYANWTIINREHGWNLGYDREFKLNYLLHCPFDSSDLKNKYIFGGQTSKKSILIDLLYSLDFYRSIMKREATP